jgi:hypothetical protein
MQPLAFARPGRCLALTLIIASCVVPQTATASSYWDTVIDNAVIVIDTALGNLTARQEKDMIAANWDEYRRQKRQAGLTSIGQVAKDGSYPVADYLATDLGSPST